MARFWSSAGAEDQHHQTSAGSYPGSRAAEQAFVGDILRRDGQWEESGTMRGFGPERESIAHFLRYYMQNSDHLDSGGN